MRTQHLRTQLNLKEDSVLKYYFTGRVHPERSHVTFDEVKLSLNDTIHLRISSDSGQIRARVDTATASLGQVRDLVEHYTQMIVSALGFSEKRSYSVEITNAFSEDEDQQPVTFGIWWEEFDEDSQLDIFNRSLHLSSKNIHFRMALRDFTRAIMDKHDAPLLCYRALEGISKSYEAKSNTERWDAMNKELGSDEELTKRIVKKFADPIRHGDWGSGVDLSPDELQEMLSFTYTTLITYLRTKNE